MSPLIAQSKALDQGHGPMHILSASGMATGGRVVHHLKVFAPDPRNLMRAQGALVDGYCTGTRLSVSEDAPLLDCAYLLHEYAGGACRKRSIAKESWPGPRQVFRQLDPHGRVCRDVIASADETMEGRALVQEVMIHGRREAPSPSLQEVRAYGAKELASLPLELRTLEPAWVRVSMRYERLQSWLTEQQDAPAMRAWAFGVCDVRTLARYSPSSR